MPPGRHISLRPTRARFEAKQDRKDVKVLYNLIRSGYTFRVPRGLPDPGNVDWRDGALLTPNVDLLRFLNPVWAKTLPEPYTHLGDILWKLATMVAQYLTRITKYYGLDGVDKDTGAQSAATFIPMLSDDDEKELLQHAIQTDKNIVAIGALCATYKKHIVRGMSKKPAGQWQQEYDAGIPNKSTPFRWNHGGYVKHQMLGRFASHLRQLSHYHYYDDDVRTWEESCLVDYGVDVFDITRKTKKMVKGWITDVASIELHGLADM